ncbi:hypothetical protein L204_106287 [Cryptococcus depauperatus]|nr:hypothetical protein L204_05851 [Cryptococcus depauperatus CBS 7855]
MRRIPSQVPTTVGRLLQGDVIKSPPTWYTPVLAHPPPQLPPYSVKHRARPHELPPNAFSDSAAIPEGELERRDKLRGWKQRKGRPERIVYEEDRIRRQFFKDFPFEALRPISMIEGSQVDTSKKISGQEWTKLEQRGGYPTVEDTIDFIINLKNTQSLSISDAYAMATLEFVELRARHQHATIAAELEASHYGAEFKPDAFEREFNLEQKALSTLASTSALLQSSSSSVVKYQKQPRWQWSNTLPPAAIPSMPFSTGENYVARWKMPEPVYAGEVKREGDLLNAIPEDKGQGQKENAADDILDGLKLLSSALGSAKA